MILRFCDLKERAFPFRASCGADILTAVAAGAVGELHVLIGRQWLPLSPHVCVGFGPQTREVGTRPSGLQSDAVERIDAPTETDAERWLAAAMSLHAVWATGTDDEAGGLRANRAVLLADLRENLRRKLAWIPEAHDYDDCADAPTDPAEFEEACRANGLGRDYERAMAAC